MSEIKENNVLRSLKQIWFALVFISAICGADRILSYLKNEYTHMDAEALVASMSHQERADVSGAILNWKDKK